MAKKKYIIGNWKMNPESPESAKTIFSGIKKAAFKAPKVNTVICPPHVYISLLVGMLRDKSISIGAQDLFHLTQGSFTGEVSAEMLSNSGVEYVIIGHSERRNLGETSEIIHKKVLLALENGLDVVLCVGEKTRDLHGDYLEIVKGQLKEALVGVQAKALSRVIVAYEPVWAIGAKEAMQVVQIHEMAIYVKKVLREIYDEATVRAVKVLYGGSVTSTNTGSILAEGGVDGLLIGRQSLEPKDFAEIIKIANEI